MIFSTERIREHPVRALSIVAGLVPLIGIFSMSASYPTPSNQAKDVVGRPPSVVFILTWISICLILLFGSVVASLRFDVSGLVMYTLTTILIAVISMVWLYLNSSQKNKAIANQTVASLIFATLLLTVISVSAGCDKNSEDVHLLMGSLAVVPMGWSILATMLGYIDANK